MWHPYRIRPSQHFELCHSCYNTVKVWRFDSKNSAGKMCLKDKICNVSEKVRLLGHCVEAVGQTKIKGLEWLSWLPGRNKRLEVITWLTLRFRGMVTRKARREGKRKHASLITFCFLLTGIVNQIDLAGWPGTPYCNWKGRNLGRSATIRCTGKRCCVQECSWPVTLYQRKDVRYFRR